MKRLCDHRAVKVIAILLLLIFLTVSLTRTYRIANRDGGYDFTSYLLSSKSLLHGGNPYATGSPFAYSYPMFLAFALLPLSFLPYSVDNLLWYLINAASLLGSLVIIVNLSSKHLKTNWGGHLYAPVILALLLMTAVLQNHLLNGQVNFIVLLLCVLFLKYDLQGREFVASGFLALAAAIKLVPLIFLLYLLIRRKYQCLVWSAVLFVALCLLPAVVVGERVFGLYAVYLNKFVLSHMHSAPSALRAYFTPYGFLASIAPVLKSIFVLKVVLVAAVIVCLAAIDAMALRRKGRDAGLWTFHLYLMATLLISPLSEIHHLAFLLPAFVLLLIKLLYDTDLSVSAYGTILLLSVICYYVGQLAYSSFYFGGIVLLFASIARLSVAPTDDMTSVPE